MPKINTHLLLSPRSAPPVFGRPGVEYFEIDEVDEGRARVEGEDVGGLEVRSLADGVTRMSFALEGSVVKPIDDLLELPAGEKGSPDLTEVGGVRRYRRSHGGALNTALSLGIARGRNGQRILFDSFALTEGEELYGLGERHISVKVKGARERVWIGDPFVNTKASLVYLSVPLILSTGGWGVAVLDGGGVIVEAGNPTADALTIAVESDRLDYLMFEADDLAAVVRLVTSFFGLPKLPPDWSLGVWMSRCMYYSRDEVMTMLDALEKDGFPVAVVHLDPHWHASETARPVGEDRTSFEWNEKDFGPLDGFMAELRRRRIELSLWESPYLREGSALFAEADEAGHLLAHPRGPATMDDLEWHGGIVDFTNPEAAHWWKGKHRPLLEAGVAAIKTDFGESVPASARFSDGRTGAHLHNAYPLLYHRVVAEACREVRGDDFVLWARSGFFGSARDDVVWVGDSVSTWKGMIAALRSVLSLSLSGWPFVSVDIGGFILWDEVVGPPAADLFVRWSQWGLLLSHSRFHGVGGREPVLIEEPERSMVREMCLLRMRWLPYLESLCRESASAGAPVVRPLVYTWPDDPS
ncbi:MAG: TIM-barrel domain-containing protein, partial [Actinomycetota bacterium]